MGSFTSKSIVIPAADVDEDVNFDGIKDLDSLSQLCSYQLRNTPHPFKRSWKRASNLDNNLYLGKHGSDKPRKNSVFESSIGGGITENIRILQWNALSQSKKMTVKTIGFQTSPNIWLVSALGTKNDNFIKCPKSALDWNIRRFRMLEEMIQHKPDIICLQEIDHFGFFERALGCLGYKGMFFPKPDSPCIYLPENSGPDGCAIFFKEGKFDLKKTESKVIEVWRVQSNQVVLSATLRSKLTGEEILVATTHLKARSGALLSTLRNEQGKFLLEHLNREAGNRPVVITGDFNAEPSEPVYETMKNGSGSLR